MGKRQRRAKDTPQRTPTDHTEAVALIDVDDDYVAYASEGSDEAQVANEASSDLDDSDSDDLELGPRDAAIGSDGEALSDVEVSFEFFDPTPEDESALVRLLGNYASETGLDARKVAQAIIRQTTVGTCVKITDEPEPIAFISCLSTKKHTDLLQGLFDKIRSASEEGRKRSVAELIQKSLDEEQSAKFRMGLILTERVVNLPPVLVAKMQEAIFSEIEWATEDESDPADRDIFRLRWYLYVTDGYRKSIESEPNDKKRRKEGLSRDDVVFPRIEDEAWMESAEDMVSWSIEGTTPGVQGLTRVRMAMVVPSSKITCLRGKTLELVSPQDIKAKTESARSGPTDSGTSKLAK